MQSSDESKNHIKLQAEMADLYPKKEGFKMSSSDRNSSCKTVTNSDKWKYSLLAGIIFLIVSAPLLYKLVDGLLKKVSPGLSVCDEHGCPTPLGLAIHSAVFVVIVKLMMK
jgi:hypothetical protein